MCVNPETFFNVRQQFVGSYSAVCASGYILGIGDRHLDNLLINTKTAKIIGIDFGYVFGTATQVHFYDWLRNLIP